MTSDAERRITVREGLRDESLFERAMHALPKDRDYAHELLAECVLHEPGNLRFVEAMLDNLTAWFRATRKKPRSPGFRSNAALRKAIRSGNSGEVFRLGTARLLRHPWHVPTLHAIAKACERNHLNEVELRYLKQALDADPHDREVNRHCAASLARMGQYDQAIACWHRVEQDKPGDREAKEMILKLSLEKTEMAKLGKLHGAREGETKWHEGAESLEVAPQEAAPARVEPSVAHVTPSHFVHAAARAEAPSEPRPLKHRNKKARAQRRGVPWVELALGASCVALLLQLFPSILDLMYEYLRVSVFLGNAILLVILVGIRRWMTRKTSAGN